MRLNKTILVSILMLIVLALNVSPLYSQSGPRSVSIRLQQPPPNQLNISSLWRATLTNNTKEPIKIYLEGYAEEEKGGRIVEGRTDVFTLTLGKHDYKYEDFKTGTVNWINKKYEEPIIRTGTAPSGTYTICMTAKNEQGEIVGMEQCITHIVDIKTESEITLISPEDGSNTGDEVISFVWSPPVPAPQGKTDYELKIVEVYQNQSANDAIKNNTSFFYKENIGTTQYQYSKSDPVLSMEKKYAWIIIANQRNKEIARSEVYAFQTVSILKPKTVQVMELFGNKKSMCESPGEDVCILTDLPLADNKGVKAQAYVKDGILVLIQETKLQNKGYVKVDYDFPLHPYLSKKLGYERIMLKKGTYNVEYKNSKFGEIQIPVYEMSNSVLKQRVVITHTWGIYLPEEDRCVACMDQSDPACNCDLVTIKRYPWWHFWNSKIKDSSTCNIIFGEENVIIEFDEKDKFGKNELSFFQEPMLDKRFCDTTNIPYFEIKDGKFKIDYYHSKNGMVVIPYENETKLKKVGVMEMFGDKKSMCESPGEDVCFVTSPYLAGNKGVKANAYVKDGILILEQGSKLQNKGYVKIDYDFPLHPDFSKVFGYDRMVMKKGTYQVDYKNSEFGEIRIPVYDFTSIKKVYGGSGRVKTGKMMYDDNGNKRSCDCSCFDLTTACEGCYCMFISGSSNLKTEGIPFSFYFMDNYFIMEFDEKTDIKESRIQMGNNLTVEEEFLRENKIIPFRLKDGEYVIDKFNSKHGRIVVPLKP